MCGYLTCLLVGKHCGFRTSSYNTSWLDRKCRVYWKGRGLLKAHFAGNFAWFGNSKYIMIFYQRSIDIFMRLNETFWSQVKNIHSLLLLLSYFKTLLKAYLSTLVSTIPKIARNDVTCHYFGGATYIPTFIIYCALTRIICYFRFI